MFLFLSFWLRVIVVAAHWLAEVKFPVRTKFLKEMCLRADTTKRVFTCRDF